MKTCCRCKRSKSLDAFNVRRLSKDGRNSTCRECYNDPVVVRARRDRRLMLMYGITLADFERLLRRQKHRCAICPRKASHFVVAGRVRRSLNIDHNHACCPGKKSCGKCIRGLLCVRCNRVVGAMEDDASLLRRAAEYLERS